MRFDYCRANLHIACEEHKYDHCEMCNIARAYQHGYETAQENMPKDAVEVVRCKDCKHYVDAGTIPNKSCCGFCTKLGAVSYYGVDANDYCSFGERKGGDDE